MKLDQIRWESVAKVGAGLLLAVAIATSLPSLLTSEQPKPLEPDVGLPQAALPPPAPPTPPKPKPKPKRRPKHRTRPQPHRHRDRPDASSPAPSVPVAAPVVSGPPPVVPGPPPVAHENFGFERP